jgi:hypothetical protein|tara:strand:+ start:7140 stop:7244 length:105 start_codon:yes stop_codon:yes gene_type:complete
MLSYNLGKRSKTEMESFEDAIHEEMKRIKNNQDK